jgi:DNA primase
MKAFAEDQRWASQSFVAVAPTAWTRASLRLRKGPAVASGRGCRADVRVRRPHDDRALRPDTAEGRVQAMKVAAPVINSIKDPSLRPEYERTVAGWIGVGVEQLADAVRRAGTLRPPEEPRRRDAEAAEPTADELAAALPMPNMRDPLVLPSGCRPSPPMRRWPHNRSCPPSRSHPCR